MRLALLSIFLVLVLAPISSESSKIPLTMAPPQASKLDLTSYTASEIVAAASKAGIDLYTEAEVAQALAAGCKKAADVAVAEAIPKAVNIALADYDKKHRLELTLWKGGALACAAAALSAIVYAAAK